MPTSGTRRSQRHHPKLMWFSTKERNCRIDFYRLLKSDRSMTAEVAILNRHGIAIAADSAITIGQHRVWKTSNKIFSLGPRNDIAIMIYGGADFGGLPWETIIKSFKKDFSSKDFKTVEKCSAAFKNYLNDKRWFDGLQSKLCGFSVIVKEIEDLAKAVTTSSSKAFRKDASEALDKWNSIASSHEKCLPDLTKEQFITEFGDQIEVFRKEKFSIHFPKYLVEKLNDYLFRYFVSEKCSSEYQTGVVVCGYGSDQYYPALTEIIVDGRFRDKARAWYARSADLNADLNRPAQIIPFAQRDMTNLFMEGVSSSYIAYFFELIEGILKKKTDDLVDQFNGDAGVKLVERRLQQRIDEKIIEEIRNDFGSYRSSRFVQPLMANVNGLPRDEMAAMAEALVELTSLRRKIDSVVQSVAGPVDVAVISKADGVVWLKRKHYFDPDRNPEFFQRKKLLEGCDE